MHKVSCKAAVGILCVLVVLALFSALVTLCHRQAFAENNLFTLYMDDTIAESSYGLVADSGGTFYVREGNHTYTLVCSADEAANMRELYGGVGFASAPATQLRFGYGWDFGSREAPFDICLSYYYMGTLCERTIPVRAVQETSFPDVWTNTDGWTGDGEIFRGTADSGTLTLLMNNTEDLKITAATGGGSILAHKDGGDTVISDGEMLTLPAADGTPYAVTFTYRGVGTAELSLAESRPVRLLVDYDDRLGTVSVSGSEVLAPGEYIYESGSELSFHFAPAQSVPSSLRPEENVSCVLEGYRCNNLAGTVDSLMLTISEDTQLHVTFSERLPSVPTGGTVSFDTADGVSSVSFSDGDALTLTDVKRATISIPAPGAGEYCTAICGNQALLLHEKDGYYACCMIIGSDDTALTFLLTRAGYRSETITLTLRSCASVQEITLCEDNVYERVCNADGEIVTDYSLYAEVLYSDGTRKKIPLTCTEIPNGTAYLTNTTLINEAFGFRQDVTLLYAPASFARYNEGVAALADAEDPVSAASGLYALYRTLLDDRTEEEQAYAKAHLPVGAVLSELVGAAAGQTSVNASADYSTLCAALSDLFATAGIAEADALSARLSMQIDGTTLTEENFSSLWRGGEHPLVLMAEGKSFPAGHLTVRASLLTLLPIETTFPYTGEAILPFQWDRDLTGLLESANANCFTVTYWDMENNPVDTPTDAGSYLVRVEITHGDEYAFESGTKLEFEICIEKSDISTKIEIYGIPKDGTLYIGDKFTIFAQISGISVQFKQYLYFHGTLMNVEMIDSQQLTQEGLYTYQILVDDKNYCGERTVSFRLAESSREAVAQIEGILDELETAAAENRAALLMEMRDAVLNAIADGFTSEDAAFGEILAKCEAAWEEFSEQVVSDLAQTPSVALQSAAALSALNAIASLAVILPEKFIF